MNRTALITGASAGLGLEFCRQLASQGYQLVLVARNAQSLDAAAAQLSADYGVKTWCCPTDLSEPGAPDAILDFTREHGIDVDYLVNNAGIAGPDLLKDDNWEEHESFFRLMMTSIARMCQLFAPPMQNRGFGRIINIASVAGRIPRSGNCNYGPSKAWVIAFSEELALTVQHSGVNVSALCPGFTHTEFHDRAGLQDMKAGTPAWVWYSAETVVRDGLRAVEKGRRVCVSGRLYRWLDPFFQSVWTRRLFSISDNRRPD